MNYEFRKKYLPKWEVLIKSIFTGSIPERYEWTNLSDIILILSTIGKSDALNHTFFSGGGGSCTAGTGSCVHSDRGGLGSAV